MYANRAIRQRAKNGIQFIYTGSIGLPNIARKMKITRTINDLNVVEVPPLTQTEAADLSQKLFANYNVQYETELIGYMLQKIDWLMPFFVQLVVQLLIDEYESKQSPLTANDVDMAIDKASNHRSNIYFENYYRRLIESITPEESKLALTILNEIAQEGAVPLGHFDDSASAPRILEMLEYDGYVNTLKHDYRFNSPILRHWWLKYAK